jgi:hypothetical protein
MIERSGELLLRNLSGLALWLPQHPLIECN